MSVFVPTRDEKIGYIWDTYKAAHGFRPRFMDFDSMSDADLDALADDVTREAEAAWAEEQSRQSTAWTEFKKRVRNTIAMGAASRDDAIRWILQGEGLDKEYDAGYICYCLGLGYDKESVFKKFVG